MNSEKLALATRYIAKHDKLDLECIYLYEKLSDSFAIWEGIHETFQKDIYTA